MSDKTYEFFCTNQKLDSLRVTINYDGSITIRDFDYEYEQSMVEFGENPSECLNTWNIWSSGQPEKIFTGLSVDAYELTKIAIDWLKHAVTNLLQILDELEFGLKKISAGDIVKERAPQTYGDVFRISIKLCEEAIDYSSEHRKDMSKFSIIKIDLFSQVDSYKDFLQDKQIVAFLESIHPATTYGILATWKLLEIAKVFLGSNYEYAFYKLSMRSSIQEIAVYCRKLAYVVAHPGFRIPKESDEERVWQIRRFIDIIDAVKNYRPYPMLAETL